MSDTDLILQAIADSTATETAVVQNSTSTILQAISDSTDQITTTIAADGDQTRQALTEDFTALADQITALQQSVVDAAASSRQLQVRQLMLLEKMAWCCGGCA